MDMRFELPPVVPTEPSGKQKYFGIMFPVLPNRLLLLFEFKACDETSFVWKVDKPSFKMEKLLCVTHLPFSFRISTPC